MRVEACNGARVGYALINRSQSARASIGEFSTVIVVSLQLTACRAAPKNSILNSVTDLASDRCHWSAGLIALTEFMVEGLERDGFAQKRGNVFARAHSG